MSTASAAGIRRPTDEVQGAPAVGRGFELSPARVARNAVLCLLVVLALNVIAIPAYVGSDGEEVRFLAGLFMVNLKDNLPTFFNFLLLIGVGALLALLTVRSFASGDRWRRYWLGLALIFLLLAYDEAAELHEHLGKLTNWLLEPRGYLFFRWVIPAGIAVLALGLVYLRFVLSLPRTEAMLTILGGGVFLAGAIGVEMVSANHAFQHGKEVPSYIMIATFEDVLEMLGLIVFGYALLRLLADEDGTIRVRPATD